jgi:DNA-binding transcriptional ArsR family regulator
MWQDGFVNDAHGAAAASDPDQGSAGVISGADTLRALADPLRLRILSVLMQRDHGVLPVMSVKEVAADLGEPQTKLYRHIKHLEAAGLIKVVATRVVSGIVEHRYQACQSDLMLGSTLDETQKVSAEAEAATAAVLELYRTRFFAAYRARLAAADASDTAGRESSSPSILCFSVAKVPPAKAAELRERLQGIVDDLTEAEAKAEAEGAETVTVEALLGCFSPDAGS